jgi:hypothetical protein
MRVRLTQIDGKLPSLALMKLAHWHRAHGDELRFSKRIERQRGEPIYERSGYLKARDVVLGDSRGRISICR